jgi:predicted TIM-barrel enzyme
MTDDKNSAPKDAQFVLSKTKGVHGFFGASSMERLPVEVAITDATKNFKAVQISS